MYFHNKFYLLQANDNKLFRNPNIIEIDLLQLIIKIAENNVKVNNIGSLFV